jgi:hypothetical protein
MIRCLLLAALPILAAAQTGGAVDGSVVDSATRAAIAGVKVDLQQIGVSHNSGYNATTDASGVFHIEGLPSDGDFRVSLFKEGYMPGADRPIHLNAATAHVHLDLTLAAMPKLRGKVTDSDGRPVEGVTVQLRPVGGGGGVQTATAKDGTYQFTGEVLPGACTLRAVPPRRGAPPKSDSGRRLAWAPTYYPGSTERWSAAKVILRAGSILEAYDIRLVPVPVFHIRGAVLNPDGKPAAGARLALVSPDSLDARSHAPVEDPAAEMVAADNGAFDFADVPPGEWHVIVTAGKSRAVVSGAITSGDWDNLRIQLTAPFTVRGVVERPDLRKHTWVGLLPAWQVRLTGIHDDRGNFEIGDVVPGKYRLVAEDHLPGVYLDSVQFGGREILGQTVDVMDGALTLRVVYKADGGTIRASADGCDGGIGVVLPKDPALQTPDNFHLAECDQAGQFQLANLRPGSYIVGAFTLKDDFIVVAGMMGDPRLISAIVANAETVQVAAGQSTLAIVKAIPLPE